MSLQENKTLVRSYLENSVTDLDLAFELLDEGMTWWLPTDQPGGMTRTKDEMHKVAGDFFSILQRTIELEILYMTAEEDRVCVQMRSRGGLTKGGASYANDYHMLFRVRNGKIVEIYEYLNPLLVAATNAEAEAATSANTGN